MLSGETANGAFPSLTVSTMAAIVRNAELVNNYYAVSSFIRDFTPKVQYLPTCLIQLPCHSDAQFVSQLMSCCPSSDVD
eukprot:1430381-Rhodomonas_salina.1